MARQLLVRIDSYLPKGVEIPIQEQVEVLSLTGDIAFEGDVAKIHAHIFV